MNSFFEYLKKKFRDYLIIGMIFIYFSEGDFILFNPIGLWNIFPLLIFYLVARKKIIIWNELGLLQKINLLALVLLLVILPIVLHIGWVLNYDGIKTSSSTSGLIFLFLPIWLFVFSAIPLFFQLVFFRNKK